MLQMKYFPDAGFRGVKCKAAAHTTEYYRRIAEFPRLQLSQDIHLPQFWHERVAAAILAILLPPHLRHAGLDLGIPGTPIQQFPSISFRPLQDHYHSSFKNSGKRRGIIDNNPIHRRDCNQLQRNTYTVPRFP